MKTFEVIGKFRENSIVMVMEAKAEHEAKRRFIDLVRKNDSYAWSKMGYHNVHVREVADSSGN